MHGIVKLVLIHIGRVPPLGPTRGGEGEGGARTSGRAAIMGAIDMSLLRVPPLPATHDPTSLPSASKWRKEKKIALAQREHDIAKAHGDPHTVASVKRLESKLHTRDQELQGYRAQLLRLEQELERKNEFVRVANADLEALRGELSGKRQAVSGYKESALMLSLDLDRQRSKVRAVAMVRASLGQTSINI